MLSPPQSLLLSPPGGAAATADLPPQAGGGDLGTTPATVIKVLFSHSLSPAQGPPGSQPMTDEFPGDSRSPNILLEKSDSQ